MLNRLQGHGTIFTFISFIDEECFPQHDYIRVVLEGCKRMAYVAHSSREAARMRMALMQGQDLAFLTITSIALVNVKWSGNRPYSFGRKELILVHEPGALKQRVPPSLHFNTHEWLPVVAAFALKVLGVNTPNPPKVAWLLSASNSSVLPSILLSKFSSYGIIHTPLVKADDMTHVASGIRQKCLEMDHAMLELTNCIMDLERGECVSIVDLKPLETGQASNSNMATSASASGSSAGVSSHAAQGGQDAEDVDEEDDSGSEWDGEEGVKTTPRARTRKIPPAKQSSGKKGPRVVQPKPNVKVSPTTSSGLDTINKRTNLKKKD